MTQPSRLSSTEALLLATRIKQRAAELGFQQLGITDTHLGEHIERYQQWLAANYHGSLSYMSQHGSKRWQPALLIEGTLRVLCVRMNYLAEPPPSEMPETQPEQAYISRYALGRDYHKLLRARLAKLIQFIHDSAQGYQFRAFVDSAPVLERALAQKAGLGWFGKNTMLLNRSAGSWFFLGEIYTDLPLPLDPPFDQEHCGHCTACLEVCPTQAFVGPYILDARRCISYLTIELKGSIPIELRKKMGNRIFGCDDCQLVCPWNRFSQTSTEPDFSPRHRLDQQDLLALFDWDEATFLRHTEGSALRRTGYESWLRNIAIALGNAPQSPAIQAALRAKLSYPSELVREHILWALAQQDASQPNA